jgi:hypothetical protein
MLSNYLTNVVNDAQVKQNLLPYSELTSSDATKT